MYAQKMTSFKNEDSKEVSLRRKKERFQAKKMEVLLDFINAVMQTDAFFRGVDSPTNKKEKFAPQKEIKTQGITCLLS